MKLICRWFGHKWKQEGKYSNVSNTRYVCERCLATAAGVIIPSERIEHPLMTISFIGREIKALTEEETKRSSGIADIEHMVKSVRSFE